MLKASLFVPLPGDGCVVGRPELADIAGGVLGAHLLALVELWQLDLLLQELTGPAALQSDPQLD